MGKIFYLMGKSSSGKDTVYKRLCSDTTLNLHPIILYTTRPIRDGEEEGVQYHFTSEEVYHELTKKGVVIEARTYNTMHGDWTYFTVDDGSIDLDNNSYIAIGTLESYEAFSKYYGHEPVVPVYIEVEDGERLERALRRERRPENHKYKEMCRRFLADCEDFSEEKINRAGITAENRFENINSENTVEKIKKLIISNQ